MKTNLYYSILAAGLFFNWALFSTNAFGQCTASFTYTTGSNGLISFTSSVTGATPPITYQWDFGDGVIDNSINPTHTYNYNTLYRVCLKVFSAGCYDSLCNDITVTNALQNISCPGNATFTATPNGPGFDFTNTSGNWKINDFGDGSPAKSSASNVISHQYSLNGTYQVIAIASSYFGNLYLPCDTDTVNITATNIPCKASFYHYTDSASGSFICIDSSLGATNRTWYVNGAVVANNVTTFSSGYLSPGTYTVCLVIDGPVSCKDSTCQAIALNYTTLCPNVTFASTPLSSPCDTYQFSVINTGPPLTSISWMLNSTPVSTSATTNITLDFSSPSSTVYSQTVAVLVNGPGCTLSNYFNFSNPASFYMSVDTTPAVRTWYAYPLNNTNVASELWDFGDGTTNPLPYPSHSYSTPGSYKVCHTQVLTNGCSYTYCINGYFYRMAQSGGMSHLVVVGPTGVKENSFLNDMIVYPNPSSSVIHFDFSVPLKENLSLGIYNVLGALVKAVDIPNPSTSYLLNIADIAGGVYYYQIREVASDKATYGKIYVLK